jgi:integrase
LTFTFAISFYCLLRTDEALRLKLDAIQILWDKPSLILDLGMTRSGKRKGCREITIADDPEVVCLAAAVLAKHGPTGPIIPAGSFFRKSFGAALTAVGINTMNFRPYSLRREGATHHWQITGDLGKVTE